MMDFAETDHGLVDVYGDPDEFAGRTASAQPGSLIFNKELLDMQNW